MNGQHDLVACGFSVGHPGLEHVTCNTLAFILENLSPVGDDAAPCFRVLVHPHVTDRAVVGDLWGWVTQIVTAWETNTQPRAFAVQLEHPAFDRITRTRDGLPCSFFKVRP